jgi:translation initiation factor 2 subunit 2
METYEQLLKKAYSSMPEKKKSTERFEIPVAECLVQGDKTLIKNFDSICKTMRRNPKQVSKIILKELAAPGSMQGNALLIQGKFSDKTVNEKIQYYFKNYVSCKECGKPDTHFETEGRNTILVCEVCGARKPVK